MSYESELQTDCNELLKQCDILFHHKEKGRVKHKAHSKGLPDLIIWNNGKCIFVELKRVGGKQSPDQATWEARSYKAGIPYYICTDMDRFVEILNKEGIL
jgi:hypothetical protein